MNSNNLKDPDKCISKEEIREQIDFIDREIIELFSKRFDYVREIVKFKTDGKSIVAQDRKDEVIQLRGEWAEKTGLDKSTFEEIFRLLIDSNIEKEMKILEKMTPKSPKGDL